MLPSKNYFKKYTQENNIPWHERNVLMEYLQINILKAFSLVKYNDKLSFLGGTALHFVYGIDRFSEDLDFDLVDKKYFDIKELSKDLVRKIELLGFQIDFKIKTTKNIHIIYVKFRNVLKEFKIKAPKNEKFLIKFEIDYNPSKLILTETRFINSFNERFPIIVNTLGTIFAQKIIALFFRPYQKGRDFYDIIWFLAQKNIEPNYKFLKEKGINCENKTELISKIKKIITKKNLKTAAKDVERFLFYPERAVWILNFEKYLNNFEY